MKAKAILMILAAILMVAAGASTLLAASGSSAERPENATPPYGLKVEGDAKGTKLEGTITVEYYDMTKSYQQVEPIYVDGFPINCIGAVSGGLCCGGEPDITANARVVVRLRQGNELHAVFGDVGTVPVSGDPADIQMAIQNVLVGEVLTAFFGAAGDNMSVTLKNVSNFEILDTPVATELTDSPDVCTNNDITAPEDVRCTSSCGGSQFVMADIVVSAW